MLRGLATEWQTRSLSPYLSLYHRLLAATDEARVKTLSHVQSACNSALHCMRLETRANFKIYERAYHGSKFSSLLRRVSKILKFANLIYQVR